MLFFLFLLENPNFKYYNEYQLNNKKFCKNFYEKRKIKQKNNKYYENKKIKQIFNTKFNNQINNQLQIKTPEKLKKTFQKLKKRNKSYEIKKKMLKT